MRRKILLTLCLRLRSCLTRANACRLDHLSGLDQAVIRQQASLCQLLLNCLQIR